MNCIFCSIAKHEMGQLIDEDDHIVAFNDIDPKAPIHILIVPKQHIATLNDTLPEHKELLGHMILTANKIATKLGVTESGYRLILNCNKDGGQAVYHIHLHLLAGRQMTWPPG